MKTTLNKIRECSPCSSGWTKLLATLNKTKADDDALSFLTILMSNGLDDVLWCLRSTPEYDRDSRLFAVWCARQVEHLLTDKRSINAINVAEAHANGLATEDELASAWEASWYATRADDNASAAAWGAAEPGAAARASFA